MRMTDWMKNAGCLRCYHQREKYLHLTYSSASLFGGFQGGPSMFWKRLIELVNMEESGTVFDDGDTVYVSEDEKPKKTTDFERY